MAAPTAITDAKTGALQRIIRLNRRTRDSAIDIRARASGGTLTIPSAISYMGQLTTDGTALNTLRQTPGLGPLAQDEFEQPAKDLNQEELDAIFAMQAARDWLDNNLPKSAVAPNEFLERESVGGIPVPVTPAASFWTAFVALLDTVVNSFESN